MNFSHLEQFLKSLSNTYGIPGASCRVWHQHKEIFSLDVGVRDITTGEAIHGNEQIDFYSASKPITAVAAMQLMEKGLLSPGDPISRYFPTYANTKVVDEAGNLHPLELPITVGHMMSMTSGFTYDMSTPAIKRGREQHNGELPTLAFAEAIIRGFMGLNTITTQYFRARTAIIFTQRTQTAILYPRNILKS